MKTEPNKAVEPTPVAVTVRAVARTAPSTSAAHLGRSVTIMKISRKLLFRCFFWLGFIVLLLEVVSLHFNQLSIRITPLRIENSSESNMYYPRLVCRISNPRLTPIRYMAVSDSMVAYEIIFRDINGLESRGNNWCTANFSHTLGPLSSKEVWIWTEGVPDEFDASIFYLDTSFLSWFSPLFRFADEKRATKFVNTKDIPKTELK